jgi:pyrroloquinoline-quinone synthase
MVKRKSAAHHSLKSPFADASKEPTIGGDLTAERRLDALVAKNFSIDEGYSGGCRTRGTKANGKNLMNAYLDKIDDDIAEKHLLKHPFYLAWTHGELSKEALIDYAKQYYHHVTAFPTYLSAVHAKCNDQAARKQLLDNLIDEEAGSPNHSELWLEFAEGLGASDADVRHTIKEPETKNLIDTFRSVCREGSTAEGLAALYAYESQIPAICESKVDGLKKHYGFTDPERYRYFTVHVEADRKHSFEEREMLGVYIDNRNFESVRAAVNRILAALWEMLSGVCRRHAIAC